jgi:hypothetical protein
MTSSPAPCEPIALILPFQQPDGGNRALCLGLFQKIDGIGGGDNGHSKKNGLFIESHIDLHRTFFVGNAALPW